MLLFPQSLFSAASRSCPSRFSGHFLRMENLVKALLSQEAELHAGFFQGKILPEGKLCGFCSVLIADIRIQGGYKHKRTVQILPHLLLVRHNPAAAAVRGQTEGNYRR